MTDPTPDQIELLRQVRLALQQDDLPTAVRYLEQMIELAHESGDVGAEGRHLGNLALLYYRLGDPERSLVFFRRAVQCARRDDDRTTEGGLLGNMGNILREIGNHEEAVDHLNRALIISNENGDMRGRGIWLSNLGLVYDDLQHWNQAIVLHEQAVEVAEKLHDQRGMASRLSNLGNSYVSQGKYKKALKVFSKAVEIFRKLGDQPELALRLGIMGNVYSELGNHESDSERSNQYYAAALKQYAETITIARELNDHLAEAHLLRSIGNVLGNVARYDDAIQYFTAAQHLFTGLEMPEEAEQTQQSIDLCINYRDKVSE